jgi:hypothetical protein
MSDKFEENDKRINHGAFSDITATFLWRYRGMPRKHQL